MNEPASLPEVAFYLAGTIAWVATCRIAVVRSRRRADSWQLEALRFIIVATAGAVGGLCGLALTAHWMDLASQPNPTPAMVAKDLVSVFTPVMGCLAAAGVASAGKLPLLTARGPHGQHAA